MLVIGAGATGAQVASIFNAFGTHVQLFQAGSRIVPSEDESVSSEVAAQFRLSGIDRENFGSIDSFEKTPTGIRMNFSKDGAQQSAEAALAVIAVGWVANTADMDLSTAGVAINDRGFVKVNEYLQTTAPHIFAAGDVTGGLMLVPQALQGGFVAATNAVQGPSLAYASDVSPIGNFTDPEYAQVGLTEAEARKTHDVLSTVVRFDSVARTIIDGRKAGFCKLLTDRKTYQILGCHVVGERAVDIVQLAAIAIAAGMKVNDLSRSAFVSDLLRHPGSHRRRCGARPRFESCIGINRVLRHLIARKMGCSYGGYSSQIARHHAGDIHGGQPARNGAQGEFA